MDKFVERKKTKIDDIDRGIYDIFDAENHEKKISGKLSPEMIKEISKSKNEPKWMLEFRLKALEIFNSKADPDWGPDLSEVDVDNIAKYVKPKAKKTNNWEELPKEIKESFERLGLPEAEKKSLAGISAQYDSEEVYHNTKSFLNKLGVIYMDISEALLKHEDLVKKYFGKVIKRDLHKYAALHYAVWSGGSFVYVPEDITVGIPIQSYYRLNAPGAGQFEHTLIIAEKGADVHYIEGCSAPMYNVLNIHAGSVEIYAHENSVVRFSTIENWSRNMYNLNTKRAIIEKNAKIQWVSGSFGSRVSMLYPASILKGEGAISEYTGITFAGKDQNIDNGCSSIHLAPNTYSTVNTKSITKDNGISTTRNYVYISKNAVGSKSNSDCETLMLSKGSVSDTIPVMDIRNMKSDIGHEAKIGKIDDNIIFYLMTRGLTEEDAKSMVVRGFAEPLSKLLPLEYAVEMNRLIDLELEGTNG